jgi:hypothetical protein
VFDGDDWSFASLAFKKMVAQWQLDNLRCRGRGSGDFTGIATNACQRGTPFLIA